MGTKKILVVDDEQDCREFVKAIVESDRIQVVEAQDGVEGLEMARKETPDLIILDIQMPRKGGFRTFAELKSDSALKSIPVIMLTSVVEKTAMLFSKDDLKEYCDEEPEAFHDKPIEAGKLLALVEQYLHTP